MEKRLYRSRRQRIFAGVCGGLAEYFGVDVVLVRLAWAAAAILGGSGILLYILAAIIIPANPYQLDGKDIIIEENGYEEEHLQPAFHTSRNNIVVGIGLILIILGGSFLIKELFPPIWYFIKIVTLPAILIFVGIAIIVSASKKK